MFKYGWVIRLWPLFPKIIRLPFFLFFLFWCVICCTSISVKSNLERIPDQPCVQFIIVIINNVGGHFKVEHRLWCLNVCNIYSISLVTRRNSCERPTPKIGSSFEKSINTIPAPPALLINTISFLPVFFVFLFSLHSPNTQQNYQSVTYEQATQI